MSILIRDATIVTQNSRRDLFCGHVYVEDDIIQQVSKKPISVEADFKINGKGKLVMPGLINTHTHIPMTLLRGYGDDMALSSWLKERIWPVESKLDSQIVAVGTKLGLLEMIASGTTTFVDMYFFENAVAENTERAGVRGFLGFTIIDAGTPEYTAEEMFSHCERFIKRWKGNKLIEPMVAPHGTYTCSPETLKKSVELARKYDVLLHTHCSETRDEVYDMQNRYGVRPVEQLKKHGLLDKNILLAHCGWITKNEIVDIAHAHAAVLHCPVSNMKLATGGFAPIPELLNAGIAVGLGTDGAASNNTLDMFDTMKFTALLHKQHRWDPCVMPAQRVLNLATTDGARCIHMEKQLGSIEEGKKADLIMLDLKKPHLTPHHDLLSHLVYAAQGSDVCTTIVNGKPLMLDHEFLTLDYDHILADAEQCAQKLTS